MESEELVGNESVDHRQRQALEEQACVDELVVLVVIGSREQSYLVVVLHQSCLDGMSVVFLLQIHQLGADIADGAALVGHIVHGHVADHRQLAVGILDDVEVAVEDAGHLGQIVGQDAGDLAQVQLVEADGDVLQRRGVAVLGIDFYAGAVVGNEVYLRAHLMTARQQDEVVGVEVELLVADGRTFGQQVQVDAGIDHLGLGAQTDAQTVVDVVVAHAEGGAALLEQSVDEGVEDKLRVLLVVAHLTLERQVVLALYETEIDGVEAHVVDGQRMDEALAVDACLGRRIDVEQQLLEVDALTAVQEGDDGIVLLALDVELHDGKQAADGGLVDDALVELTGDGIAEYREAPQEAFVVAAGVGLDDEVTALCAEIGGVGTCLDEQPDVTGTVGLAGVAQRQVVDESADAMG